MSQEPPQSGAPVPPWPAAVGNREILEAYKVTTTATKFALDVHGIITFQKGYGVGSQGEWSQLLRSLAAS